MPFKTFAPTPAEINQREWWLVDAQGETLGRLSAQVAAILRGKHKPGFAPNQDMGDFVVIINCDKVHVTGRRMEQKIYYRHSGYIGGMRATRLKDRMKNQSERVVFDAVKGMLPKNKLGRQMIKKLRVYAGSEHDHAAQNPKPIKLTD